MQNLKDLVSLKPLGNLFLDIRYLDMFRLVIMISVFVTLRSNACTQANQYISSIHSYYDDSFREWIIVMEDETEGRLELKWPLRESWNEWKYEINDSFGTIKTKWADRFDEWELRGDNQVVTMRTKWRHDFTKWRISNAGLSFDFQMKYNNDPTIWQLKESNQVLFEISTDRRQNILDWYIFDELPDRFNLQSKMAMVFIALYHATPKI